MLAYDAVTETVRVTVRPAWLDGQTDVVERTFAFAYFVRIENDGPEEVQLLRRRWLITDADGHVQEVEGPGVVGAQPVIAPGEAHEYHSFCVLRTFEGAMEGSYLMQRPDGSRFHAQIPRFDLVAMAN